MAEPLPVPRRATAVEEALEVARRTAPEQTGPALYHGTSRTNADRIRSEGWKVPGGPEPALFFSDDPLQALEFGRLVAGAGVTRRPDPYHVKVLRAAVKPDDLHTFNARGEVYDPDLMAQAFAEAKDAGKKGVKIKNVVNFEGGQPSTTYAVFDPSLISLIKRKQKADALSVKPKPPGAPGRPLGPKEIMALNGASAQGTGDVVQDYLVSAARASRRFGGRVGAEVPSFGSLRMPTNMSRDPVAAALALSKR